MQAEKQTFSVEVSDQPFGAYNRTDTPPFVRVVVDPVETACEGGTRIRIGFPVLEVLGWVREPESFARHIAALLTGQQAGPASELLDEMIVDQITRLDAGEVIPASQVRASLVQLQRDRSRLAELKTLINTPQLHDFAKAVVLEAAHQRERWSADHDAGKEPHDWFWLLGYLGGKALKAHQSGDVGKALHHTISTAAALANWHAAISGDDNAMRPGIAAPAGGEA